MGINVKVLNQADLLKLYNKIETLMLENIDNISRQGKIAQVLSIPASMSLDNNPGGVIKYLTALKGFEEWKGEVTRQTLEQKGIQIIPKVYSNAIQVSNDDIKQGKMDAFYMAARAIGEQAVLKEIESIVKFFEDATNITCYDGSPFFGNAHKGGQDNDIDKTGCTNATPTVAQAEDGILTAIATMQSFKNEFGQPAFYGFSGQPFIVLVPSSLATIIERLEYLDEITSGVTNGLKGRISVIHSPYLSNGDNSAKSCYIIDASKTIRPIMKVNSYPLETKFYENYDTDELCFRAKMSWEIAPSDWKAAVKLTFKP